MMPLNQVVRVMPDASRRTVQHLQTAQTTTHSPFPDILDVMQGVPEPARQELWHCSERRLKGDLTG
jgi:hypothetical protein